MNGYYDKSSKKIIDFTIGLFGIFIIAIFMNFILRLIMIFGLRVLSTRFLLIISNVVLYGGLIYIVLRNKRYYLLLGAVAAFIIPLLIVGACFGIMAIVS